MRINSKSYYPPGNTRAGNSAYFPKSTFAPVRNSVANPQFTSHEGVGDTWNSTLNLFNRIFMGLTGQESILEPTFINSSKHLSEKNGNSVAADISGATNPFGSKDVPIGTVTQPPSDPGGTPAKAGTVSSSLSSG